MIDYQVHTLHNGIRLLFKHAALPVTHCCFMINAGARDEAEGKDGLAHFIEHLLFKATERRNTTQILNRLEQVGADLNAYTTKEYTCLHASLLKQHLERALDLFEDLVFHSVFPQNELEKERGVVLDEIASYLDQPDEAIQDDFESILFKGHTLGNNILGTPASVSGLGKTDINEFIVANYNTSQMVFGISGDYDFKKLVRLFEKYFDKQAINNTAKNRIAPKGHVPEVVKVQKPITQTHCVIGGRAYSSAHQHRFGLLLLNNLLGGMGMSNRLNLEIREKHGIAYTIESNYTPLTDTGMFSIYFGTDYEKAAKATRLVHRELKKLRDAKLGAMQLHQAKQKFSAQIALGEENRLSLILSMCKSLMDFDRVDTLEEVFEKVNAVTAEQLLEISNEVFDPAALSTLVFEPNGEE